MLSCPSGTLFCNQNGRFGGPELIFWCPSGTLFGTQNGRFCGPEFNSIGVLVPIWDSVQHPQWSILWSGIDVLVPIWDSVLHPKRSILLILNSCSGAHLGLCSATKTVDVGVRAHLPLTAPRTHRKPPCAAPAPGPTRTHPCARDHWPRAHVDELGPSLADPSALATREGGLERERAITRRRRIHP
jgi:hypothetical protein